MRRLPIILALFALLLSGCERAAKNMYEQPKYKPMVASNLWADGQSARPDVPGTVARSAGTVAATSSGRMGVLPDPVPAALVNPLPSTIDVLKRGQERYNIYCAPCHSEAGDGDGMVVRRGFPRPQTFHDDALRNAPDSRFFKAITDGYGVMYAHGDRITPADRWAIVDYIRALQLSQNARVADLTSAQREKLQANAK
jgi:mono/diheme cytochrome c family protein